MSSESEYIYQNYPGIPDGVSQTWQRIKRDKPAYQQLMSNPMGPEEVSVVRTEDGKVVVMSFINAKNKFASIVQTGYPEPMLKSDRVLEIQFLNRTFEDIVVTRRNGITIHCPHAPQSSTSRQFIIREIYRFGDIEEIKDFIAKSMDVASHQQSSAMRLMLTRMRAAVEKYTPFIAEDLRYVIDYRIDSHALDVNGSIYDPNADIVVAYKNAQSPCQHPKFDDSSEIKLFSEFKVDDQSIQNIHSVNVFLGSHEPKRYFYKLFGNVHVIDAIVGAESKPTMDPENTSHDPLNSYVEVWATKSSRTVKSDSGYLTSQHRDDKTPALLYRISLEDARKRFGLFDTAELARDNGDCEKVEQEALRSEKLDLERQLNAMKIKQAELTGKNSDEEFTRRLTQLTTEHEQRLVELAEQKQKDENKYQAEVAATKAKHDREMETLAQKLRLEEEKHKQSMTEKSTSHQNTMTESSRKDTSEIIKIVGGVILGAAAIVVAVVKILPLLAGVGIVKGICSGLSWLL